MDSLRVGFRHEPEQADAEAPDKKACSGANKCEARDPDSGAQNGGDEHELAFPAEEQVRAVQRAVDRRLSKRL